jgi:hypothetical protein
VSAALLRQVGCSLDGGDEIEEGRLQQAVLGI